MVIDGSENRTTNSSSDAQYSSLFNKWKVSYKDMNSLTRNADAVRNGISIEQLLLPRSKN